ncbi:VOC family protein [Streptomyces sp. G1]|uniref:VOC family protein n=1 Tax=Streptomyces sp. G1 TaxID=361572 RepID=UPI00202DFCFA|nr:VOC family protein [Streptomyces sp. G1]MCM1967936.1 glyoxalase [Streptomyces sp. G1]
MDIKLELVAVPVTDIDRAKAFYERIGFHADHDITVSEEIRFVQLTPPGSACSIAIGKGLTRMTPGSLDNMQVVVADIEEAFADLKGRGIEVTEIEDMACG